MAAAAEKETAAAQARLTDSVVKKARNLAPKIQYSTLTPMWLLALFLCRPRSAYAATRYGIAC